MCLLPLIRVTAMARRWRLRPSVPRGVEPAVTSRSRRIANPVSLNEGRREGCDDQGKDERCCEGGTDLEGELVWRRRRFRADNGVGFPNTQAARNGPTDGSIAACRQM